MYRDRFQSDMLQFPRSIICLKLLFLMSSNILTLLFSFPLFPNSLLWSDAIDNFEIYALDGMFFLSLPSIFPPLLFISPSISPFLLQRSSSQLDSKLLKYHFIARFNVSYFKNSFQISFVCDTSIKKHHLSLAYSGIYWIACILSALLFFNRLEPIWYSIFYCLTNIVTTTN